MAAGMGKDRRERRLRKGYRAPGWLFSLDLDAGELLGAGAHCSRKRQGGRASVMLKSPARPGWINALGKYPSTSPPSSFGAILGCCSPGLADRLLLHNSPLTILQCTLLLLATSPSISIQKP